MFTYDIMLKTIPILTNNMCKSNAANHIVWLIIQKNLIHRVEFLIFGNYQIHFHTMYGGSRIQVEWCFGYKQLYGHTAVVV